MALTDPHPPVYNGFRFPDNTETMDVSGKHFYDPAGRVVSYVVWTITLKTTLNVNPGNTTDAMLDDARIRLSQSGADFTYTDRGFGNLTINVPVSSNKQDVLWGPKPQLLRWKPKGGLLGKMTAVEVIWTVEVAIPECTNALFELGIMEFNYTVKFQTDESGYTTRIYSGHLRIPQTREAVDDNTLTDIADEYFERIVPDTPIGYRRKGISRTIDESKCGLTFEIVYEPTPPQALQAEVVHCEARQYVANADHGGFERWQTRLEATYELARHVPKARAWELFLELVKSRTDEVRFASRPGSLFFTSFSCEEDIFGRSAGKFTASWEYATNRVLFLLACGLWKPVPNTDYQIWKQSLANTVLHPLGLDRSRLYPNDDAIVSLCDQNVAIPFTPPNPGGGTLQARIVDICPPISPNGSWVHYENSVNVVADSGVLMSKPLPTDSPDGRLLAGQLLPGGNSDGSADDFARLNSGDDGQSIGRLNSNPPEDVAEVTTTPTINVVLRGDCLRLAYPIVPPELLSWGGITPILLNVDFEQKTVANYCYPLIYGRWEILYQIPIVPLQDGNMLAANPAYGVNAGG